MNLGRKDTVRRIRDSFFWGKHKWHPNYLSRLLHTVKDGAIPAPKTARSRRRLVFLNGDIVRIKTGGTLLDRDIINELNNGGFDVRVVHPALVQKNKRWWKPTIVGFLANFIEAWRTFDKNAIVLISHGIYRDIWIAKWIWLLRFRVRIVYFAYHFDFNLKRGISRSVRWIIESLALRGSSLVFTISEASRAQTFQLGIASDTIRIMPVLRTQTPLAEVPIRDATHPCVFLFVGTVEPRKGLHVALEAFALLGPESVCEFRIAGVRNPAHFYTKDLARKAEMLTRCKVRFLDRISEAELEKEYLDADAFLFPSLWEGYGIVVEEALCHGLPVISTNAGAIPEIIRSGVEGWLVPPSDVCALAGVINECIQNPHERTTRARAALKRAHELAPSSGPGVAVRNAILELMDKQPASNCDAVR